MKPNFIPLLLVTAGLTAAALVLSCSTDPCEDLQSYAESCDGEVRARGLQVADAGDKDQCRLYRDSWYVTWQPRCSYDGGGTSDVGSEDDTGGGILADAGATDAGTIDAGAPDAGGDL